ncbi:MAG: DNA recombination protein RmuC [Candidatus Dojkabacteria bacterium]|nr:MAG: DNA recombination protein RmuC [Candidatus Dojkabacteria bacterium]
MEIVLIALIVLLIIVLVGAVFFLSRKISELSMVNQTNDKMVKFLTDSLTSKMSDIDTKMEDRMNSVKDQVSKRLNENVMITQNSTKEVNDRLTNASKVIGDLRERISAFEEGSKRIYDLGKDLSELQNILKAPKLRGGFGEWMLEELLAQILPRDSYELQYRYPNGDIVDAIVKLKENYFLPIDSKFPLENFRKLAAATEAREKELITRELAKDMKKHVDAISSKYISKSEKSLDVALMYIPAENIYYEAVVRDDEALNIRQYCFERRVVPVSPNTLYAYIQIILLGMRGMQVSKKAKEILDTIKTMESEFGNVVEHYSVVGKHLGNAQSKYNETDKYLARFSNKLQGAISLTTAEIEDDEQGQLPT